jgi:hypothetical protein
MDGELLCRVVRMKSSLDVMRCLAKDLGAHFNQRGEEGVVAALIVAVEMDYLDMVSCLVTELDADVNQGNNEGFTALSMAAGDSNLNMVRCLLKLRAKFNQAASNGSASGRDPLIAASMCKHEEVVAWLVKAGADTQATYPGRAGTAAVLSSQGGASASQTAYLEAKTHCSNPSCSGAGFKKCPACKQARYCGEPCKLAHWKAHKADCKRWRAELAAGKGKGKKGK